MGTMIRNAIIILQVTYGSICMNPWGMTLRDGKEIRHLRNVHCQEAIHWFRRTISIWNVELYLRTRILCTGKHLRYSSVSADCETGQGQTARVVFNKANFQFSIMPPFPF
jgi:hypothetical protein